jgi:hypothetical protein
LIDFPSLNVRNLENKNQYKFTLSVGLSLEWLWDQVMLSSRKEECKD